jgi:hypothetical protein
MPVLRIALLGVPIILIVSSATGCGLIAEPLAIEAESSCGYVQDTYGRRVSWEGQLPVQIHLAPNWPPEFVSSAQTAAAVWNAAAGKTIVQIAGYSGVGTAPSGRDHLNGLYWFTDWSVEKSHVQAITGLLFVGDMARDADIRVNAKHFSFFVDEPEFAAQVHMESLLIHEIGHLLGLKHFMIPPTVMDPNLSPSYVRVTISESDKKSLDCEYGP